MHRIAWLAVPLGILLGLHGLTPPAAQPADAPAARFAAERAFEDVTALARGPRVPGSPEHDAAREHLVARLRDLGYEPQLQEAGDAEAPVRNVLVRVPAAGTDAMNGDERADDQDRGAVLLAAHYDSVPAGPGAADDAMGCAVVLEIARALRPELPARRPLILLLTDAEERGLVGARAFRDEHPWFAEVALALNFEARGNAGPAWMFQTGPGNLALVEALARAPWPAGSSLAKAVYDRMPNDTDLTVFLEAGVPGMNWSCIDGYTAYHTARDTAAALDRGTLQHMGDQGLAMARWALAHGGAFRAAGPDGAPRDAAYANVLGRVFVHHPIAAAPWIAAVVVAAAVLWAARRRPRAGSASAGCACALILVAVAAGLAAGVARLWPDVFSLAAAREDPGRLHAVALGTALAVAIVTAGAWRLARRLRIDLVAGSLLLASAATVGVLLVVPEGGILLWIPLLPVLIARAAVPGGGALQAVARGVAALPLLSVATLWTVSLMLALGPAALAVPAAWIAFCALLTGAALAAEDTAAPRRAGSAASSTTLEV